MEKMWYWSNWWWYILLDKERKLEIESYHSNWAQCFGKCDLKTQKCSSELTENPKYQPCIVLVHNDLVDKKIKNCRSAS